MQKKYSLEGLLKNYQNMLTMLESVVRQSKEGKLNQQIDKQLLDWFYAEGWDWNYGAEGNFYKPGPRNLMILKIHNEQNTQSDEYKKLLTSVWGLLPDFYLMHKSGYTYIEPPIDYNPNHPYPGHLN